MHTHSHSTVDSWMSALTLEEKVHLVIGMGMIFPEGVDVSAIADAGIQEILDGLPEPVEGHDANPVPGQAGTTFPVPRLGIRAMVLADGPAGLRIEPTRKGTSTTFYATAFPIATALASSWNRNLLHAVGEAIGAETHDYGVDIILMPALNLHRNPLCGRNFEYFSEDPLLSGQMAAAMVQGVQSRAVGTSVKHFAANNQETHRTTINAVVSERTLRELYLRGFEIAIQEGKPWTVMSSYNRLNGTYTSESRALLTTILREQWGYEGVVMTDWFAGSNLVAQLRAGNDLLMPGTQKQRNELKQALAEGRMQESELDTNVRRILELLLRTPSQQEHQASNRPDLKAHAQISRNAAAEGMVLLQNAETTLPLPANAQVALFGNASYALITGGTGSGDVNEAYSIALDEGLRAAGFHLDATLLHHMTEFLKQAREAQPKSSNPFFLPPAIPEHDLSEELILAAAEANDFAIVTLGRNSGEFEDRKLDDDFHLSAAERKLLNQVSAAFRKRGKRIIVVLNIGGVIETASWCDLADAILIAWQPGQEGGHAITDVLSGRVNPSGKLPMTFPLHYEDAPSAANFPGLPADNPKEVCYEEGLYLGYRYFTSFQQPVAFPFGHGLSYTTFSLTDAQLSGPDEKGTVKVQVRVQNNGSVAGKQVVQLYLSAPQTRLEKPKMELKGFAKSRLLQPGEGEMLSFILDARALASYDTDAEAWVADAGAYTVHLATSSVDPQLQLQFHLDASLHANHQPACLSPNRQLTELRRQR
ncbi:MAG: glycoside hydrolase family 3 N-terminal domain-containing protein [Puniceicoccaceae bacterium]